MGKKLELGKLLNRMPQKPALWVIVSARAALDSKDPAHKDTLLFVCDHVLVR